MAGQAVYAPSKQGYRLKLPRETPPLAELPYGELDALGALKGRVKTAMLAEAKQHPEYRLVKSCPGLDPVGTAELLPIVVTPFRFQTCAARLAAPGPGVGRTGSEPPRTPTHAP